MGLLFAYGFFYFFPHLSAKKSNEAKNIPANTLRRNRPSGDTLGFNYFCLLSSSVVKQFLFRFQKLYNLVLQRTHKKSSGGP